MEKISQTLAHQISKIQRRFESFLENESDARSEDGSQVPFEISKDLGLIRGLSVGLPEDTIDKAIVVFSRLALFFETGVLLENVDANWRAQASFQNGHTQLVKQKESPKSLKLPAAQILAVLKVPANELLGKIQLPQLQSEKTSTGLLVKLTPDFAVLLVTQLADPWLRDHMEKVRLELINAFTNDSNYL